MVTRFCIQVGNTKQHVHFLWGQQGPDTPSAGRSVKSVISRQKVAVMVIVWHSQTGGGGWGRGGRGLLTAGSHNTGRGFPGSAAHPQTHGAHDPARCMGLGERVVRSRVAVGASLPEPGRHWDRLVLRYACFLFCEIFPSRGFCHALFFLVFLDPA